MSAKKEYTIEFRCNNCNSFFKENIPFGFEVRFNIWMMKYVIIPTGQTVFGSVRFFFDMPTVYCPKCGSNNIDKTM